MPRMPTDARYATRCEAARSPQRARLQSRCLEALGVRAAGPSRVVAERLLAAAWGEVPHAARAKCRVVPATAALPLSLGRCDACADECRSRWVRPSRLDLSSAVESLNRFGSVDGCRIRNWRPPAIAHIYTGHSRAVLPTYTVL
eukprot:4400247-Prymnesium_polylepis.1